MNLQINWSNQAEKNYNAILDEVEMEWGKNTLAKLVKRVNGILQGISQFPKMYPKHSTENIRKAVK